MESFQCNFCSKALSSKAALKKHLMLHKVCEICKKMLANKWALKLHYEVYHPNFYQLQNEAVNQQPSGTWQRHQQIQQSNQQQNKIEGMKQGTTSGVNSDMMLVRSGFNNRIQTFQYKITEDTIEVDLIFQGAKASLINQLQEALNRHYRIKFNLELGGEYVKPCNENIIIKKIYHNSKMMELERADNIDNILNDHFDYIKTKMSEFQERDSGWALLKVFSLKININKHSPIRGSQYIPTPKELKNKRVCINIYNGDIYCFKWCLIAALETSQPLNPSKCSSYAIDNINSSIITLQNGLTLNFEGIEFPMELKYIKLFEEKNPNISVNVFGYEYSSKSVVGPYYITKQEKDKHVNLLLLENDGKSHYILIKSLSR